MACVFMREASGDALEPILTTSRKLTEVTCVSGSAAIRAASMAIQSGLRKVGVVIGCQKMTEMDTCDK